MFYLVRKRIKMTNNNDNIEEQFRNLSLTSHIKSPLKWGGGKADIMSSIIEYIPQNINTYYEPFLGSGSVMLYILQKRNVKKCIVGDINQHIIYLFTNIRDNLELLLESLKILHKEYISLPIIEKFKTTNITDKKKATNKAAYFYYSRNLFNSIEECDKSQVKSSALFVFLNKTAFRGLYRENKSGKFNVPFGNYDNPNIVDEDNFRNISKLIKDVIFHIADFQDFFKFIENKPNNFLYLDPPYFKETKTSFDSYTSHGFDIASHTNLFDLTKKMNIDFLLSNSNTDFVKNSFKEFSINYIECKRRINSKKPGSKTLEVLITKK